MVRFDVDYAYEVGRPDFCPYSMLCHAEEDVFDLEDYEWSTDEGNFDPPAKVSSGGGRGEGGKFTSRVAMQPDGTFRLNCERDNFTDLKKKKKRVQCSDACDPDQ